jgi:4-amino-4-deoxy-L-arabinose transferase-like glycosyltransferase
MKSPDANAPGVYSESKLSANGSSHALLICFSLAVFFFTLLPRMLNIGMFFDGVTYASISRNLAQNHGTIWHPYYTDFAYPQFYEQPSLGFFLQSFAYRLFGDSLHVEAFWGVAVGLLILAIMCRIWGYPGFGPDRQTGAWLPVLMFTFIPMTSWLLSNNMLEGTMTVFSTLAALLVIASLCAPCKWKSMALAFISGSLVLCAVLIKGPVGFFPYCIPAVWFIVNRAKQWRLSAMVTALMILGFLIPLVILALTQYDFLYALNRYCTQQVIASVSGYREKGTSSIWILLVVLRETIVPLALGMLAWGVSVLTCKIKQKPSLARPFWFYFLIALCASLPIAISQKQLGWYIFPSLPFYSLALAALFKNLIRPLQEALVKTKLRTGVAWGVTIFIFVVAVLWMFAEKGSIKRQKEFHYDFSVQPLIIPSRQDISVYPPKLKYDWVLVANMQRQFGASLSDFQGYNYLLTTVRERTFIDSLGTYRKIHPSRPSHYILYERRN